MDPIAKMMILAGSALLLVGLFWDFGTGVLHLGKLPGDIAIKKPGFAFYFPLTTSLLVSLVLTLGFLLYRTLFR
ncbi:DUF2905 domain-containing protein [Candidatus Woesearchaeota archaeon]|nr:DUF2905 domain-containing protein [Candidatus Woesearchaeota archaeon]